MKLILSCKEKKIYNLLMKVKPFPRVLLYLILEYAADLTTTLPNWFKGSPSGAAMRNSDLLRDYLTSSRSIPRIMTTVEEMESGLWIVEGDLAFLPHQNIYTLYQWWLTKINRRYNKFSDYDRIRILGWGVNIEGGKWAFKQILKLELF